MIFSANSAARSIAAGKLASILHARHSDGRAQSCRFDKQRKAELFLDERQHRFAVCSHSDRRNGHEWNDGKSSLLEQALLHVFIHADRGAEHAGADVGKSGEFEQALHSAVFAKSAVQDGKHNVDSNARTTRTLRDGN